MSTKLRTMFFLFSALGFSLFLGWGMMGLPSFGDFRGVYGDTLNKIALSQRHATNIVTSVAFDYRGIDTMGEESVLFTAVIGVSLLLREATSEFKSSPDDELPGRKVPETSEAVRFAVSHHNSSPETLCDAGPRRVNFDERLKVSSWSPWLLPFPSLWQLFWLGSSHLLIAGLLISLQLSPQQCWLECVACWL